MQSLKGKVLKCISNNEASKLCCQKECRFSALICRQESCRDCKDVHSDCTYREVSQLTKRIENKIKLEQEVLDKLLTIQEKFMNMLLQTGIQLRRQINIRLKNNENCRLIFDLYNENRKNQLTSKEINTLFNTISLTQIEKKGQKCLKDYQSLGIRLINDIINLRQSLYQKFFSGQPIQKQKQTQAIMLIEDSIDSQLADESPQTGDIIIDSNILHKDKKGFSKFKYIMTELAQPIKFNLLFRASQHHFSSQKFHELCDGYSDTLTIVKTQFDKTIAGFTKLAWGKSGQYAKDSAFSSFLLQLECKQKMTLVAKSKAIFNHIRQGPTFGKDLVILDRCNQSPTNHSSYPKHYKYSYGKQLTATSFCGAPKGQKFRVIEYEVFQVIK